MSTHDLHPIAGLRVRGLEKRLGETRAIDGVDLELARGEVVGLVGPNGAGKSTLLQLCAGLLAPDEGTIHIAGLEDPRRPLTRVALGYAPQSTSVYDELTVEENLVFFGQLHGLEGESLTRAVSDALALSMLTGKRAARTVTLSGGMRRRLHVAAAVVHAPTLLLLDEPTVGVDAESCDLLLRGVTQLGRRGVSVLFSSHHEHEVARVCQRVVHMARGRIVAVEDVEGAYPREAV